MKQQNPKSDLEQRAKLRLNEQKRAERAYGVLRELGEKHGIDYPYLADLYSYLQLLTTAIKTQHIKEPDYAQYRKDELIKKIDSMLFGDF